MGRVKDTLGEAPPPLGAVRRLGATALFVAWPPPCKRRASIQIAALRLPDDTPYAEVTTRRCLVCTECDRRADLGAISID